MPENNKTGEMFFIISPVQLNLYIYFFIKRFTTLALSLVIMLMI